MKPWIRRTLLGLFGASVVLGGVAACSHHPHHGGGSDPQQQARHRDHIIDRVASRLDLTAPQKAKLVVLADTLQAQRIAVMQQDPRTAVRALVATEKFDRAKAQALAESAAGAVRTGSPATIAAMADFYDSLDPRQQAQVRERLEGRHRWWQRP